MQVVAVADDLSGATETLAALGLWGAKVWLNTDSPKDFLNELDSGNDMVIDTNSRLLSTAQARLSAKKIRNLLSNAQRSALVFRKVDSLLRGNIATEVEEALDQGPVVIALANPETGRTNVDGSVLVKGVALHETGLWDLEEHEPWRSIGAALGNLPSVVIPLVKVRSGVQELAQALIECANARAIAICDAETDTDLDAIAQATRQITDVQLIGTAGLARAIARIVRPTHKAVQAPSVMARNVMVIVGSGAEASRRQVAELDKQGTKSYIFGVEGTDKPSIDSAIGSSLVLTGGETARVFLESMGIEWVKPFAEIENGLIASTTSNSQIVVIKPGSYGDDQTLIRAVNYIKNFSNKEMSQR